MITAPLLGAQEALAHGAMNGPRRGRRASAAEASSLTLMVRRRPAKRLAHGLSAAEIVREEAKAAGEVAMKVSAAARSLNLFKREVYLSDSRSLEHGQIKTWAFIISFMLSSIVILGYYGSQSQIIQKTVYKPSLDNYLGYLAAAENPSCPCTKVPTFQGVVTLHVPDSANFTQNFCATLKSLREFHQANPYACAPTDDTCASIRQYMLVAGRLCNNYERALAIAFRQAASAVFPPTLLDPDAFTATALQTAGNTLMQGLADGESVLQALQMPMSEPPKAGPDLSYGALQRTPAGCSCNASYLSAAPPSAVSTLCQFRAPFDTRPANVSGQWFGCGFESNVLVFPVSLLLAPSFYAAQGVPPEMATNLSQFSGAGNVTDLSYVQQLLTDGIAAIFPLNFTSGDFDSYDLLPGVLTADYTPYFSSCAPATCILSYEASPTFVQAVTTALGVLSGLNTALRMAVDMGYDYFCEKRCAARMDARRRRKAAGATLPGEGHDDGEDSSDSDADWDDGEIDETPDVVAARVGVKSPLAQLSPLSPHTATGPTVLVAGAATGPTTAAGTASAAGATYDGLPHLHASASGNSLNGMPSSGNTAASASASASASGAFSPTGPMRAQRASLAASSHNRLASLGMGPARASGVTASTGDAAAAAPPAPSAVSAGLGPSASTSAAPFGAPQLWRPT